MSWIDRVSFFRSMTGAPGTACILTITATLRRPSDRATPAPGPYLVEVPPWEETYSVFTGLDFLHPNSVQWCYTYTLLWLKDYSPNQRFVGAMIRVAYFRKRFACAIHSLCFGCSRVFTSNSYCGFEECDESLSPVKANHRVPSTTLAADEAGNLHRVE